jgi:nucleoside-diphosphate-sugar epimerase
LKGVARDVEVVFHVAAQVGKWGVKDDEFYGVNVRGTLNLLEASARAGVRQFVFLSTPGVQGKGYRAAPETLPYNPPYIYERTKCEAEKLLLRFSQGRDLAVTIIRPDFVYGPGDSRRLPLYSAIRDKRFRIIGNGKSVIHPTYIDDLIQGINLVTDNAVAFGEIYNIAGSRQITISEYIESIALALNVSLPKLKIPKSLAVPAALLCEVFARINGNEPFITRSKIDFLTVNHGSDISKAQKELNYRPKYEFDEGIRRTIQWCYESNVI